jgi:hypothetical protein
VARRTQNLRTDVGGVSAQASQQAAPGATPTRGALIGIGGKRKRPIYVKLLGANEQVEEE